ncbi:alpha/beta hydrolase [Actinomycetospora straminea]|uniref:Prolyl oligopeptidase family serine peptidase n=1 Tax=Actinomycetospora straminea TaxID=663607 RepID=A0ABP9F349_9PSEU|nr:alpha/beta hydrolase [Actinomycetospora straminea]MDD7932831.1 alpha/beta hydrolase [Actinomycetospora straminea]
MIATNAEVGTVAGVPFLLEPPESGRIDAPVLVGWHLMDAPRSEAAFAAALPLAGLDAWKVYLGLPMTGARLPEGGMDEVMRRGYEDAVMLLHGPVNAQAADEFDGVLAALRERGLTGPLGLFGGSAGAGVALEVATRRADVAALVAVSPMVQLRPVVSVLGTLFGVDYAWTPESDAVAARMDYPARAAELGATPVRLVVGSEDDAGAFLAPARDLAGATAGPADVVVVDGMGHALAEEPGLAPAPQTPHAAEVDAHAVAWFRQHLGA